MASEKITCLNEWDEEVTVDLIHGTRTRGIGYCQGKPTLVYAGVIQDAPRPGERWIWDDNDGHMFNVVSAEGRDAYWVEIPPLSHGSGALLV